jgi:hypothetical protein
MTKYKFTQSQLDEISLLLKRRPTESRDEQKKGKASLSGKATIQKKSLRILKQLYTNRLEIFRETVRQCNLLSGRCHS